MLKFDRSFVSQHWQAIIFLICFATQWGATSARLETVELDIASLKKLEGIRTDVAVVKADIYWVRESQKKTEDQLQKIVEKF